MADSSCSNLVVHFVPLGGSMTDEFEGNEVVPTSVPQVHEYVYPEPDYSEKAQTAEYELDAAVASMKLQLNQLYRRRRELDRVIEDLEARLKDCH